MGTKPRPATLTAHLGRRCGQRRLHHLPGRPVRSRSHQPGQRAGGRRGRRKAFGLSYDRRYHKWLPVPWDWVTPDGGKYAYPTPNGIAVVNVSTGVVIQEMKATGLEGLHWWVLDVESNAVWAYSVTDNAVDPPVAGNTNYSVYFFPYAGAARQPGVAQYHGPLDLAVRGSISYSADGNVLSPPDQPLTGRLYRADLSHGDSSIIFPLPNQVSSVSDTPYMWVGVGADTAFMELSNHELWALPGAHPTPYRVDLGGDSPQVGWSTYSILADPHGTWIAGVHGLYLLTPQGPKAAGDHTGVLAGSCG